MFGGSRTISGVSVPIIGYFKSAIDPYNKIKWFYTYTSSTLTLTMVESLACNPSGPKYVAVFRDSTLDYHTIAVINQIDG